MTWRLDWDSLNRKDWRSALDLGAWRGSARHLALRFRDSHWQPATAIAVACFLGTSVSVAMLDQGRGNAAVIATAEAAAAVQREHTAQELQRLQAMQELDGRRVAEIAALKSELATTANRLAGAIVQLKDTHKRLAELESFQRPRQLTYEQRRRIIAALAPFRGQKLTITSVLGNSETRGYRDDFVQVFEAAGWDHNGENGVLESAFDIDPTGIEVTVHQLNDKEGLSNDAINALIAVLRELNLFEGGGPKMSQMVPAGQFEFRVGYKSRKTASK